MRIEPPSRESLDEYGQQAWDDLVTSRGEVVGPYLPLLHVPTLAELVGRLGGRLRYRSLLPGADRELAILATGRAVGARFEFFAHEPVARDCGTRPEAIEAVRAQDVELEELTPREALVVRVARSLMHDRGLPETLYARALAEFGTQQLVELVTLVGYYSMIGTLLNGFDVQPPPEAHTF